MALVGLLVGHVSTRRVPRKFTAQTELELFHNPNDDPTRDMATDVALLQSEDVAQMSSTPCIVDNCTEAHRPVFRRRHHRPIPRFTFNAPTESDAVTRANTLTTQFLLFRSDVHNAEQRNHQSLGSQTTCLQAAASKFNTQIAGLGTSPTSPNASLVQTLESQRAADINLASTLPQTIQTDDLNTTTIIEQSKVYRP